MVNFSIPSSISSSVPYSKICNTNSLIGEILIPENEPCDIWCNWESGIRDFILKKLDEMGGSDGGSDNCFIDIGANLGYFSLWAATKASMVISIEPNPVLYELLNYNCMRGGVKSFLSSNIKTYNMAISDKVGYKEFYYRIDAAGDGRLYNPTECGDGNKWLSRNLPTETLSSLQDKYLGGRERGGEKGGTIGVNLIKIDCEGSEYDILKDIDFFKRKENKDCLVMLELHGPMIVSRGLDFNKFVEYLLNNFEMADLNGTVYNSVIDVPARGFVSLRKR